MRNIACLAQAIVLDRFISSLFVPTGNVVDARC